MPSTDFQCTQNTPDCIPTPLLYSQAFVVRPREQSSVDISLLLLACSLQELCGFFYPAGTTAHKSPGASDLVGWGFSPRAFSKEKRLSSKFPCYWLRELTLRRAPGWLRQSVTTTDMQRAQTGSSVPAGELSSWLKTNHLPPTFLIPEEVRDPSRKPSSSSRYQILYWLQGNP